VTTHTEIIAPATSRKPLEITWSPAERDYEPVAGTLTIRSGQRRAEYLVSEFAAGWPGRAFHLEKVRGGTDPEESGYAVFVGNAGAGSSCDCKGFARYQGCKHLAAITALVLANRI